MKKIALVSILMMGMFTAYGQDIKLGFQFSPTLSWMTTNDNSVTSSGSNFGLKFGLIAENYFQENYAITSGLNLLINQGGTLNHGAGGNFFPTSELSDTIYNNIPADENIKRKFQMVEIPIGIKLRTNQFGYLRYYGEIPFLLHIKTQARADFMDTSRENITPDTGILNLSWGIGGGAEYSISDNTSAVAGIYFHSGLFDMTANKKTELVNAAGDAIGEEDSKAVINGMTFRFGIMF